MPPKDYENKAVYYLDSSTGRHIPLSYIDDIDLNAEEIAEGFLRPKRDLFQCSYCRILFTNNSRKMHGRPLRRGIVNKKFKKYWKGLLSSDFYIVKGENND